MCKLKLNYSDLIWLYQVPHLIRISRTSPQYLIPQIWLRSNMGDPSYSLSQWPLLSFFLRYSFQLSVSLFHDFFVLMENMDARLLFRASESQRNRLIKEIPYTWSAFIRAFYLQFDFFYLNRSETICNSIVKNIRLHQLISRLVVGGEQTITIFFD